MMKFFRNPEVKRTLLVYAALSAVATAAAFLLPDVVWFKQDAVRSGAAVEEKWGFALFMLAFCLVFVIVYLVSTYRRYCRICELSAGIDRIAVDKSYRIVAVKHLSFADAYCRKHDVVFGISCR